MFFRRFTISLPQLYKKSLVHYSICVCPSITCPPPPPTAVFKRPVRQEHPGKVRLGIFPEEWFQFLYKKTGVTGPYTLGVGILTYLISKELYVLEHEFYNGLSIIVLITWVVKKLGPRITEYVDRELDEFEAKWNYNRVQETKILNEQIKDEETNQLSADGQLMLIAAKRENIALQLETVYRQRLIQAHHEVTRRLDYQVARAKIERRIAQKNLVRWVLRNVMSSMTTEVEQKTIEKCLIDLEELSKADSGDKTC